MQSILPKTESASNFGDFFLRASSFLLMSMIIIKITPAIIINIPIERIIQND